MQVLCTQCQHQVDLDPSGQAVCPACGAALTGCGAADEKPLLEDTDIPAQLGRYRLEEGLAEGGSAYVYRGFDEELQRAVAIKVIQPRLLASARAKSAFLAEARILAQLDHPGIVPVYDVGQTERGLCYLVCKFMEGSDLRTRLDEQGRMAPQSSAELMAAVAKALHHAHQHGLVHRDIKPGNILFDRDNRPVIADFGMALRTEEFGTGPMFLGTVSYMSPEQARREAHRVDARTDIYSTGVVLYELLCGRRPFSARSQAELLHAISTQEVPPLRQLDPSIPSELERICLKATALRAADRYTTAAELADDLRLWLNQPDPPTTQPAAAALTTAPTAEPARIVPRGLRAFDTEDSAFFLELLPGPRNRIGLPDSIQFWKTRVESDSPDCAFRVGVLYGPSGCGKSSLVKAGIIPRLAKHVTPIYIEATPADTEARLLVALRRHCLDLPHDLDLVETLARLRHGHGLPGARKVVLIVDQFEQWLHANSDLAQSPLTQALRHCDAISVQCLLLIRDDFWLAVHRFMHELEIPLIEGGNTALVDLFAPAHARKVLADLGRAYNRLPRNPADMTQDQRQFLDQAVACLLQEGKIIPVQLCLFAEIVRDLPWAPATLQRIGGSQGIGVTFLEQTFTSSTAPAACQLHQDACRAVLKALLPEADASLRGHSRSYQELLLASGYAQQPQAFAEVMRILDQELRLVTPADDVTDARLPIADEANPKSEIGNQKSKMNFQLTHDYLVPALRLWLTQQQRETQQGRAELCLAERAELWNARPEMQQLPYWWEWVSIRLLTRAKTWNEREQRMMRSANRFHTTRTLVVLLLVFLAMAGIVIRRRELEEERNAHHAIDLVALIKRPQASRLPELTADAAHYRRWTIPVLQSLIADPSTTDSERLLARMILLPMDASQLEPLRRALRSAEPEEVGELCRVLLPYKAELVDGLWRELESAETPGPVRIRAAAALAAFDPASPRWHDVSAAVAHELMVQNTATVGSWLTLLRPVRLVLIAPLARIFREHARSHLQLDSDHPLLKARSMGTVVDALASFADDQPEMLTELLLNADPWQFVRLWPALAAHGQEVQRLLERELARRLSGAATEADKELFSERQARAAVALFRLGRQEDIWPMLRHSNDPRLRSFVIHGLGLQGLAPLAVMDRYHKEPDVSAHRALLLVLGGLPIERVPLPEREAILERLKKTYRSDADAGVHSAAEWLLRRWGQEAALTDMLVELARTGKASKEQHWYVNSQKQTFAIIPGPVEFLMGSPDTEKERASDERQHRTRIGRSYAIACREVTVAEFLRFQRDYVYNRVATPHPDGPIVGLSWYDAVRYCRWLSEQEGIAEQGMCYPPLDQIKPGMVLPADFLTRTGYRLPTEAEWEYASRAGAVTSRFYGSADVLLKHYAWYSDNAQGLIHPGGLLMPNDLGLFDIYGNAWEWCQDPYAEPPGDERMREDGEALTNENAEDNRVERGGAVDMIPARLRSASRRWKKATETFFHNSGLRPVRTWR